MKKRIYLILAFSIVITSIQAASLKGKITNNEKEGLVGVSVYIKSLDKGTITDANGAYVLENIPNGKYSIEYRYLGYLTQNKKLTVSLEKAVYRINIELAEESQELHEVVISAGRVPEKLSTIPASITIVNNKELSQIAQSTSNMNEILEQKVPGLAPQTGSYSNAGQTLRGRKALVMIDGVPISTPLRNGQIGLKAINANDLARVEVIKGATSIYGNGSDGGFINYITKKPQKGKPLSGTTNIWGTMNLAKADDSFGGGVYQSLQGSINNLRYVGSFSYEQTGNKYDADGVPLFPIYGLDNTKIYSGFGKLLYQLSSKQEIILSTNVYKSRQDSPFEPVLTKIKVLNSDGDYEITSGYGKKRSADYPEKPKGAGSVSSVLKYNLHDLFGGTTTFSSDLYYQKSRNIFFYSEKFEDGGQSVINSEKVGLRPNFNTQLSSANTTTSLTYGIDILQDRTNQNLLDGRLWVPDITMHSIAPYLQSSFKINDNINIKAGVRYDYAELKVNTYNTIPYSPKQDGNFNPSVTVRGGTLSFDKLSFNLGLRYTVNDKFIPYINFSQGFSMSELSRILRQTENPEILHNTDIKAVSINNYEIGFMSYLGPIKIEAAGYYSTSNIGTGLTFNEDNNRFEPTASPQKIFGAELALDGRFLKDKLSVGSSFSWVEGLTESTNDKNTLKYVGGDVISPPKLTGYVSYLITPKLSSNVNVVYVGNRKRFSPYLNKNNKWTYNSAQAPVKHYTIVNMSLSYHLMHAMKVSLAVNNLFNNYYMPARSQWSAPLRNQSTVGEGTNIRLSLKYDF
ncbi:TonB-dependent receptor [uncultured Bacteroides sp.]|uniref:TonB-dependent receptor n=1 Tax=uncultured Bacteroides sp. TaxID=162156 RepID=UPI002AAA9958|nr:TonB-dependent receptor [uncultured Bacteroides sp.]